MHGSTFVSVNEILKCDHSNESYIPVILALAKNNSYIYIAFEFVEEIVKFDDSCGDFT